MVEVKTTDTFRMDLEIVAEYRRALIREKQLDAERSSILIVVGRQDTGDLEAQIRGSRHAWDVRVISVGALLRLARVKEEVEDPKIARQIAEILIPREFTRVDDIIDIVFAATAEVLDDVAPDNDVEDDVPTLDDARGDSVAQPMGFHDACVARIQSFLGVPLVRRSKVTFGSPDSATLVVCAVSKTYEGSGDPHYWFAFHQHQREALRHAANSFVAFGCGSAQVLLLIPFSMFDKWLAGMNTTQRETTRCYWHVHIFREGERLVLRRRKGKSRIDLTEYLVGAPSQPATPGDVRLS